MYVDIIFNKYKSLIICVKKNKEKSIEKKKR